MRVASLIELDPFQIVRIRILDPSQSRNMVATRVCFVGGVDGGERGEHLVTTGWPLLLLEGEAAWERGGQLHVQV